MVRRNRLRIERDGLVVDADVRLAKLDENPVEEEVEVVRRGPGGNRLHRELYDKESGDPLPEGYGRRWVDEDGNAVESGDVRYFEVVGDEERAVERHEPTLGRDRTLSPVDWVPVGELGEFLVTSTYELWAEDPADVAALHDLAEYVRRTGTAPAVPVVLRPSLFRRWGIVTPQFYEDAFSLLVRVTRERVKPRHSMPIEVGEGLEAPESERRTIEQESPFE